MKLRAKIILTAASLALSCALLAGCGSSSSSTASSAASSEPASAVLRQASSLPLGEDNSTDALNAPFETLLDANPISNQFEIAAMNIEYAFGLQAEDVVSYKGVKSNDNGAAGLVLESGQHPGALKDAVCSPGGSTIAGVHALEDGAIRATAIHAVGAAYEKTRALGKC